MAQDTPSRKLDQYIVRFPDGMRDRLKALAAESGRSLNAEIIHRLEQTLASDPKPPPPEAAEIAAEVVRRLEARDRERREEAMQKRYPPKGGE